MKGVASQNTRLNTVRVVSDRRTRVFSTWAEAWQALRSYVVLCQIERGFEELFLL